MQEEERGITLSDIFKVIFKRIWWVVGATLAVMIAFVCLIQFWYNADRQTYSVTYEVRLPSGNAYPDGTELRVEDAILLSNLQIIKGEGMLPESERTGQFSGVDVKKMVQEDGVSISRTDANVDPNTYKFTLSVTKKYFKNKYQAADFLHSIAEFPVYKSRQIAKDINYSEYLKKYDIYSTYEEKIDALIAQKDYIVSAYEKLAALYSGEYVPEGLSSQKSLGEHLIDMVNVFNAAEQEEVLAVVAANYYVFDTQSYKSSASARIEKNRREIEKNENIISALEAERNKLLAAGDIKATEAYEVEIASLVVENAKMENEITKTQNTLKEIEYYTEGEGVEAKQAFDAKLNGIRAQLEEQADVLRSVSIATYAHKADVVYFNNKIKATGGMNIIIAGIIGLILGFVLAGAVILVIDFPKYRKDMLAVKAADNAEDKTGGEINE